MKQLFAIICIACTNNAIAQIGIGIEPPHPSAELEIQSSDRGFLMPRLTNAQMLALGTGAGATEQSLLIYNSTQHSFFFWNGASWQQLGGTCNELTDEDGDTKVQVEKTANEDKIHCTQAGTEKLRIDDDSVSVLNADLTINAGTLSFGTQYSLPATDGPAGYVLGINNSGTVEWRNPAAALGLVVGIETSSFTNVDQSLDVSGSTFFVRVMPWSSIKVTKMTFLISMVGTFASTPEMGIYDNSGNKLSSGIGAAISSTSPRLVEVAITPYTLQAGTVYWFAITDRTGNQMRVYNQIFASGTDYSCRYQSVTALPVFTTFPGTGQDKGIWMAAY